MSRIKLKQSEIQRIISALPDTYYRTDTNGVLIFLSESVESIFGYKPYEAIGRKITDFYINPDDRDRFLKKLAEGKGKISGFECKMRNREGSEIWVSTSAWYYKDEDGKIKGVEGLTREITQNKLLEDMLRNTSDSFKKLFEEHLNILEYSPGGILKLDSDMVITYMNRAMEDILGVPKGERSSALFANIMDIQTVKDSDFIEAVKKVRDLKEVSVEGVFKSQYGKSTYISVRGVPFIEDGKFGGAVFLITDITPLKEMSESLKFQASHDSLTGLMNRREFENRLNHAMESSREKKTEHVICYIDLDQFKIVNDTCGHLAGDELLKQLAPLLESVTGSDNLLARLGGDEFGVIYYNTKLDDALKKAEFLLNEIRDFRYQFGEKIFEIGASIGLASILPESESISDLLAAADSACYLAKEQGRNRIQLYAPNDDLLQVQKHHMQWFQKLTRAIENDRFVVYFQPINTTNRDLPFEIAGEFLLRMIGDNDSVINPMTFIPTAERYQLMNKIDRYVIDAVFSLLSLNPNKDDRESSRKVFTINLSAQSVSMPGFADYVKNEFKKYKLPPDMICFEITETAVVSNLTEALKFIQAMRELGCLFALDDFGTGMSSLTHLKKIPVDFVKIDGSFITSMHQSPADLVMIKSVVEISRVMKLKTIAENVEDYITAEALKTLGVDYTQGFYHGHPADARNKKLL